MKYLKILSVSIFLLALHTGCQKVILPTDITVDITNEKITLNPNGYSPLTAIISLKTSVKTKITLRVEGKNGSSSDVTKELNTLDTLHDIPVLGLYAGYDNIVEIIFKDGSGTEVFRKIYIIKTDPLPTGIFPLITIDTKKEVLMAEGMTLVSYFGYKDKPFPQSPFIFDAFGDIRWYLDFTTSTVLNNLFYDDGMERLQNGNLYFGDINSNAVYEIDFFGKIINTWSFPGYQFHHNVQEKPNGNFLVSVSKEGSSTIEDFVIEIDRHSKQIIRTWDLKSSLQYSRQTLTNNVTDWIHVNALVYDASDNTIIISGRTQGVVKLDKDNNVVWIMSCHKGWGTAGNGVDLTKFLLKPLDKNNQPITSQDVIDGNTNHPDFEWNWYQHAPLLMPNGNVMLFDNGGGFRNFSGTEQYSRAVEYEINTSSKTIKQVWEYGKSRGVSTASSIVSDVDYLSAANHVIFSPGQVNNITKYGKVIEVDYANQDVIFEATLTPPNTYYGITLHRTERMKLYP